MAFCSPPISREGRRLNLGLCVHVSVLVCVCVRVETIVWCVSLLLSMLFLRQSFSECGTCHWARLPGQGTHGFLPVLYPTAPPCLTSEFGILNSGSHIYAASTIHPELSCWPRMLNLKH